MTNITFKSIGSDPEFFVFDPKGKPYPATLFAKGTKDNPSPLEREGFFEQRDNLSFEGNVPPAYTKADFIENISYLRDYFKAKVGKFGYSLSPNGVEYFERRYLKTPEGMEFGCSRVVSAWDSARTSFAERPTPNLTPSKYRVAGFHIHIGYTNSILPKNATDILIARLFDIFLTLPSHKIKPEPERLWSYGKYGMFRSKRYGVECRTLSTYFTQREHLSWVWDQLFLIESFINSCSKEDLEIIINSSHFIGDQRRLQRVFRGFFDKFTDKEILTKFNETNEILSDKTLNPITTTNRSFYTSTGWGYTTTNAESPW